MPAVGAAVIVHHRPPARIWKELTQLPAFRTDCLCHQETKNMTGDSPGSSHQGAGGSQNCGPLRRFTTTMRVVVKAKRRQCAPSLAARAAHRHRGGVEAGRDREGITDIGDAALSPQPRQAGEIAKGAREGARFVRKCGVGDGGRTRDFLSHHTGRRHAPDGEVPGSVSREGESCLNSLVSGRDAGLGAKHALQSSKLRAHQRPRLAADDAPGDTTKNTVEDIDA